MAYHIVSIDASSCKISCKNNQLICDENGSIKSIPLEDVGSIVITSFSASIHSHLLVKAAKYGIGFVICENFKPYSIILPANRCTDTLLTRAQIELKPSIRKRLWQKTVDTKCKNQFLLAEYVNRENKKLNHLRLIAEGKHPYKESEAARTYWPIFGEAIHIKCFTRDRDSEGINSLLNYGYAVLLAIVLRNLFAVGIDPTFGIFHATREHSTPLAYDLMEPFRPWIDFSVYCWVNECGPHEGCNFRVSDEFRSWITNFPLEKTIYKNKEMQKRVCIEHVIRGFRKSLNENSSKPYQPWTPKNLKWVG